MFSQVTMHPESSDTDPAVRGSRPRADRCAFPAATLTVVVGHARQLAAPDS